MPKVRLCSCRPSSSGPCRNFSDDILSKKMKIGLVCPYSINRHGGVLAVVLALQTGLAERGHDVKLITPMPRGEEDETDHPDAIFIGSSTDFRAPSHTTGQVSSITDNEKVDAILEAEQFDILNFHEPWVPLLSRQLLQR